MLPDTDYGRHLFHWLHHNWCLLIKWCRNVRMWSCSESTSTNCYCLAMSTPSHMAIAGNELVLIEAVPLGALVSWIIRHVVTVCRYFRTARGQEHAHVQQRCMGNIRHAVVHKIPGGVQAEQWLQSVATVLWLLRLPHINERLRFVYYRRVLQLGHYLILTALNTGNIITRYMRDSVVQKATSCDDKLFSRYNRQSNPHSFLCYHSNLTTRDCT